MLACWEGGSDWCEESQEVGEQWRGNFNSSDEENQNNQPNKKNTAQGSDSGQERDEMWELFQKKD